MNVDEELTESDDEVIPWTSWPQTIHLHILISFDDRPKQRRVLSTVQTEVNLRNPLKSTNAIKFLHRELIAFLYLLTDKLQAFGHDIGLHLYSARHPLGLFERKSFDHLIRDEHVAEEYHLSGGDEKWVPMRLKRRWNHSWYYPNTPKQTINRIIPQHNHPHFTCVQKGAEICLLFLECLHADPDLWTRVQGRWLLSSEFICKLTDVHCLAFLIDTRTLKADAVYKLHNGYWRPAPANWVNTSLAKCLPNCLEHMTAPSLTDDCLIALLQHGPGTKVMQSKIVPQHLKVRFRQLHTLAMRFPHLVTALKWATFE